MLETFLLNLSIKSPAACICGQPDWAKGMILLSAAWASGLSRRTAEMPGAEALDRRGGSRGGGGVVRTRPNRAAPFAAFISAFVSGKPAFGQKGGRRAGRPTRRRPAWPAGKQQQRCCLPMRSPDGGGVRRQIACAFRPRFLCGEVQRAERRSVRNRLCFAGRRSRSLPSRLCSGGLRISDVPRKRAAQRLCTYRFAAESDGRPFSRAPPIRGAASVRCGQPFFAA